jgi:spermidine/putrescine transport system permease protein
MGRRMLGAYAAMCYLFLHLPLLVLVAFSFNASKYTVWTGWSLDWYRTVFHDSQLAEAAGNSVIIALCSALLSTVIGTLAAYGMWKRRAPVLETSLYTSAW